MLHGLVSYWMIPLFSAVVWLAMLLAMLLYWLTTGKPHYSTMERTRGSAQTIPYISDVGAEQLKPLFIAMGTISVVTFDLVFIFERWLRHNGRLVHNTSMAQKILAGGGIVFAVLGAAGLILLTIFDTKRHNILHNSFLAVFIGGYVISAIFTCAEYQRLGKHFRQFRILRISFWMKLFFIIVEIALAIAFGSLSRTAHWNSAAVTEWVIALIYSVYVASFIIDFLPATRKNSGDSDDPMTMDEMATNGSNGAGMGSQYPPDRSLGRAFKDARDDTEANYHHHNGVAGTNGHGKVSNGATHF